MRTEERRAHGAHLWRNAFIGLVLIAPAIALGVASGHHLKVIYDGPDEPVDLAIVAVLGGGLVFPSVIIGGLFGAFAGRTSSGRAGAGALVTFLVGGAFVFSIIMTATKRAEWGANGTMAGFAFVGMAAAMVSAYAGLAAVFAASLGEWVARLRAPAPAPPGAPPLHVAQPEKREEPHPPAVRVEVKAAPSQEARAHADEALALMKKRMAMGEITKEDYDAMVKRIRE